jgi:ferredoxin--NADP+ reductase
VAFTNLEGWHKLDDHEKALGEAAGRERIKVVDRDEMISISRSGH